MAAHHDQESVSEGGMFRSLSRFSSTLLGIVHTRIELLRTELQEEVQYAAKLALWGFVAAFAGLMALFMGALTVVFAFWDTHRLAASLAMVGLFVVIAIAAVLVTSHKLRTKPPMLDATLAELAKDRDRLRARS
ncbi:MAG: phage holin family protein [Xanthomonadaceae bacterium]|nr:phage holin family protein [Xanthomonadaceae bacterium]